METDLLSSARALCVADRIKLVEAIWDTISEAADLSVLPIPEAHKRELEKRLSDIEENPENESTWSEVRSRLESGS